MKHKYENISVRVYWDDICVPDCEAWSNKRTTTSSKYYENYFSANKQNSDEQIRKRERSAAIQIKVCDFDTPDGTNIRRAESENVKLDMKDSVNC